jgi:DNA-binding PadR family transcriptional regulator
MYRDRTLLPKEAMRLAVLGTLAIEPLTYAALATALRHFISRIVGPSLEFTGSSLELYRLEGLIAAEDGGAGKPGPEARLALTEAGRAELRELLESGVRGPFEGVGRLVLALKMRFLHLLDPATQRAQAELMIEACETELARIEDLRARHANEPGHLTSWLAVDAAEARARLDWFRALLERL